MRKYLIYSFVLLSLVLAWHFFYPEKAATTASPIKPWVQTSKVTEHSQPLTVKAIGSIWAPSIMITPEASGHVQKIAFADGARVEKGDLLVQLDNQLEQVKAQSTAAQQEYYQSNYARIKALGKRGIISQREVEEAQASLKEKNAQAEESQALLSKMRIVAPFAGVLGQSKVNIGEYINSGQDVVMLTDTDHLRVEYALPEHFLPLLKLGQTVVLNTPTYGQKQFNARLSYLGATINPKDRSLTLYAELTSNAAAEKLLPGMFVNITQSLGLRPHTILIPARSITTGRDGSEVFRVVAGKAVATKVIVGEHFAEDVEIITGLQVGDEIVTDGQLKIKHDMSVNVEK